MDIDAMVEKGFTLDDADQVLRFRELLENQHDPEWMKMAVNDPEWSVWLGLSKEEPDAA